MRALRLLQSVIAVRRGVHRPIVDAIDYVERFRDLPFVLVHIPKNGGTAILDAIGLPGPRIHATAWELRTLCERQLAGKQLIAVYRDPVSRVASAYRYVRGGGNGSTADARIQRRLEPYASFDEFAISPELRRMGMASRLFWPQSSYLLDPYGVPCVDRLFRLDDLSASLAQYCRDSGIEVDSFSRVNVSMSSSDEEDKPADDAIRAIERLYEADFELPRRIDVVPVHAGAVASSPVIRR